MKKVSYFLHKPKPGVYLWILKLMIRERQTENWTKTSKQEDIHIHAEHSTRILKFKFNFFSQFIISEEEKN